MIELDRYRRPLALLLLFLALLTRNVAGQTTAPSVQGKIIRIWPGDTPATQPYDKADAGETLTRPGKKSPKFSITGVTRAWLVSFLPATDDRQHTAVIVCPGGGYTREEMGNEGIEVAKRFASSGIAAFVLKYRLPTRGDLENGELPLPEQDILRTVQHVRANAADLHIDPNRVGVVGFSAGGHVAAMAATLYEDARHLKTVEDDPVAAQSARPDFAVLLYPVISMNEKKFKSRTAPALIGVDPDPDVVQRYSVATQVTAQTPPLFIFASKDGKTISYHQSETMADAAEREGVPHEITLIHHGGHGFGLGNSDESKTWSGKCIQWLGENHLL